MSEKSTKNLVTSRLKAAFFALVCRLCIAVGSEKTAAKARPTVIFASDKDRLLLVFGIWHGVCFSTQANAADSIERNRSAATVITLVRTANRVMDALNDIFGTTAKALDLRSKRMELISSNIANADVAGYKSKDIDFRKLMSKEMTGVLNNTHAKHLGGVVGGKQITSIECQ